MTVATLRQQLPGFSQPNAAPPKKNDVPLGRYRLLSGPQQLNGDDFVQLDYQGGTWICAQSQGQHYAVLSGNFDGDPMAIDETALTGLFSAFDGFTYDLQQGNFYPWPLPGVNGLKTNGTLNNCCTFVDALVIKAFANTLPGFLWSNPKHNQMMVVPADLYSPITVTVAAGIAVEAPADPLAPPAPWSIFQGWHRIETREGHTFIIVDHDPATDRVLFLESNAPLGGPGFRGLGKLQQLRAAPLTGWEQNPASWTWEKVRTYYPDRKHAALKVKNRTLSGLQPQQ